MSWRVTAHPYTRTRPVLILRRLSSFQSRCSGSCHAGHRLSLTVPCLLPPFANGARHISGGTHRHICLAWHAAAPAQLRSVHQTGSARHMHTPCYCRPHVHDVSLSSCLSRSRLRHHPSAGATANLSSRSHRCSDPASHGCPWDAYPSPRTTDPRTHGVTRGGATELR